jgi:hypothetical protein
MAASPSPMSMTPAFSPGALDDPWGLGGSFFRWKREDLYEQCSDHMTEKMPSSTRFGSRPSALQDAIIFLGRKAVIGDHLGRDAGSFENVHGRPLSPVCQRRLGCDERQAQPLGRLVARL